jgi:hypothetical protein
MNDLDLLRRMICGEPETQKAVLDKMPVERKSICQKCPFGKALTKEEQHQADSLKSRLKESPSNFVWGCHETSREGINNKTLACPGYRIWKNEIHNV